MEDNYFAKFNISVQDYVDSLQSKNTKEKTDQDVRSLKVRARFGQFNFSFFFSEIEKSILVYFNCLMFILK